MRWNCERRGSLIVLALYLLTFCQAEIVQLTDTTLEHQTQASTGATTGSWFLMFHAPSCGSCSSLKPVFESLDQEPELYENSIVLGSVDVSENPESGKRFDISSVPAFLYIHKGHVYRFDDEFRSLETMKSFVLQDYSKVTAEDIPPVPSALKDILDLIQGNSMVGIAVAAMGALMMGTIGVLIFVLARGKNKSKSE